EGEEFPAIAEMNRALAEPLLAQLVDPLALLVGEMQMVLNFRRPHHNQLMGALEGRQFIENSPHSIASFREGRLDVGVPLFLFDKVLVIIQSRFEKSLANPMQMRRRVDQFFLADLHEQIDSLPGLLEALLRLDGALLRPGFFVGNKPVVDKQPRYAQQKKKN